MRFRRRTCLQRVASGLMLAAIFAFLCQATIAVAAQAAAALGSAPQPAIVIDGPLHLHGHLGKLVHFHGGDTAAGHVHHSEHGQGDERGASQSWSLGCVLAVMPPAGTVDVSLRVRAAVCGLPPDNLVGVEPEGLQRPPSTPGIA
jgi:hypothetical protein